MDKLFAVIGREFGERVRSRWFLLTTLFGPLLLAALLIGPPWLAMRTRADVNVAKVLILDATGTALGDAIAGDLAGGVQGTATAPRVLVVNATALTTTTDSLRGRLLAKDLSGLFVVSQETIDNGRAELLLPDGSALGVSERLATSLERQLRQARLVAIGIAAPDAASVAQLRVDVRTTRLGNNGREGSARVNMIVGFSVAMLLYIAIVLYGQIVLRSVAEEKQSRVAEVVLASVPARVLLSGKILGIGGVALLQLGIWTGALATLLVNRGRLFAMLGLSGASVPLPTMQLNDVILLGTYFVLGYVLYASLFALVGSIASSEQEAQQAQTPVLMLLVSSIALLQTALQDPNGTIATALSMIPFSAPIMMPLRLGLSDVPTRDVILSICLLCLTTVGCQLVAGRVYRTALLMYGKRPTLAEIIRWMRVAD
jgi:ABC-2 type transport system permease protein